MSPTIFLSLVTSEFGKLRIRLASLIQRTKRLHVRHQDDFVERGVLTLQKLQQEVEASSVVFHVLGSENGSFPPNDQVEELLRILPGFESRFTDVVAKSRIGKVTYTQWELWIAAYYQKKLCCYQVEDRLSDIQRSHLELMRARDLYALKVKDEESLYDQVILSLIELRLLTQSDVRKVIHLPYPSIGKLFKGRDEFLVKLRSSLKRKSSVITSNVLHGLGGIGKTRLAVEYAWQNLDDYTALIFVVADSPENLRRNLAELVGPLVLNLDDQKADEEEARIAAALRWLQQNPGWFLILDNVDDEETALHVENLISKLYGGEIVVTSRVSRWSEAVEPLELDLLTEESASQFLIDRTNRGRVKKATDDEYARRLAIDLGGLALALEQAAAYIIQQRLSFERYLEHWNARLNSVLEWHDPRTMKYPHSLAVTWQTTFDKLGDTERLCLDLLAWFAPNPLPLLVFNQLGVELPADEYELALRYVSGRLADYSMVHWDAENESVQVHRVVQEIVRNRQEQPKACMRLAFKMLLKTTSTLSPEDPHKCPTWLLLLPHLEVLGLAVLAEGMTGTSLLFGFIGAIQHRRGQFKVAEKFKRMELELDEKEDGSDSLKTATSCSGLAQILIELGRLPEAEQLLRRSLSVQELHLGSTSPQLLPDLTRLINILNSEGRSSEVEAIAQKALEIKASENNLEDPDSIRNLNVLELLLVTDRQPQLTESMLLRTISEVEKNVPDDHPSVASAINDLVQFLIQSNRPLDAEPMAHRSLAIHEKSYGPNHYAVAQDLIRLATIFSGSGRLVEAESLLRRAIQIDEQYYGSMHPQVAKDLQLFVTLLMEAKRLSEAESLIRQVITIAELSFGEEHVEVTKVAYTLGVILFEANKLEELEPLLLRLLASTERLQGSNSPEVATRLIDIATLYKRMNRPAEAEPFLRRAMEIKEAICGPHHAEVTSLFSRYAKLLYGLDRFPEAELVIRRSLAIVERNIGPSSPDVAKQLNNLAHVCTSQNRHAEAEAHMRRALLILKSSSSDHPRLKPFTNTYRFILRKLGKSEPEIDRAIEELQ